MTAMNALNQYLAYYRENRDVINSHSSALLNVRRAEAAATLERMGRLPERGDEGYREVSVNEVLAPDYGLNITRLPFTAGARTGVYGADLPATGTIPVTVVNDSFVAPDHELPEGVEVMSLAEATARYHERFLSEVAPADNPIVAINDLLVQDGVYIHVSRGVHLTRPVQIISTFNAAQPMMGVRRVVVQLDDDASATVIACDHPRNDTVNYLNCRVVELTLGRNARLDFNDLEESTPNCNRLSVIAADQHEGSSLTISAVCLAGGITRNEYFVELNRPHCHTALSGLVISAGKQVVDNASFVTHRAESCVSEQLFKYALFDASRGAFEGLVTVGHGARFTDARQSNRNLLVSDDARMHAMPQLVIDCDDVKASHGSATGQLNADALFYMRSRGIPEAEARMMLINAFMSEALDRISHDPLRQTLRILVDKRLRGCAAECDSCLASPLPKPPVVAG